MKRKILTDADKAWLEQGYYATTREKLGVSGAADVTTKYIRDLYKALPGCEEREVKSDDKSFTNYEYVFTTRDYNTTRKRDDLHVDDVKKPKYLILSGIHGKEKNAIISTYRFVRDVLNGHNVPSRFREGVELHVLPTGTPDAIDATSRISTNKVNINRNFDWEWVKETIDASTGEYTGASAASEKETQAIVNWLKENADAELFLDMHNSNSLYEATMLIGLENNAAVDRAKRIALQGIDRIIPYWRDVMGYGGVVQDMNGHKEFDGVTDTSRSKVFSYAATVDDTGLCIQYAAGVLGIPSLVLEISVLQKGDYYTDYLGAVDTDDNGRYDTATYPNIFDPETVASGAEAIGNVLLENYAQYLSKVTATEAKEDMVCKLMDFLGASYYSTLSAAVADAKGTIGENADANGDRAVAGVYTHNGRPYVVLLRDAVEKARTKVEKTMTINLNGHMLTVKGDGAAIDVQAADVVIDGRASGSGVKADGGVTKSGTTMARAVQVGDGFSCTIKGGRYTAVADPEANSNAIAVFVGAGSSADISGGEMITTAKTPVTFDLRGGTTISNCVAKGATIGVRVDKCTGITVNVDRSDFNGLAEGATVFTMANNGADINTINVSNSVPKDPAYVVGNDCKLIIDGTEKSINE